MSQLLSEDAVAGLLGRSLTEVETQNFNTWIDLATARLTRLLCLEEITELSGEMELLLARMFGVIAEENKRAMTDSANYGVKMKKVEDFSITLGGSENSADTPLNAYIATNRDMLKALSQCFHFRSGKVRPLYDAYPL